MRFTLPAGRILGIPIRVHFTFPLILVVFGASAWSRGDWRDALAAAGLTLAVFVCVVLHELGHGMQIRRYGIAVRDIVLLPIGGMARAERLPDRPRQEIAVALAGPAVNFGLAALLYGVVRLRGTPLDPERDVVASLFAINVFMGLFNLVPAFPMDGGRVLRGALAMRMHPLRATRIARGVGQVVAVLFLVAGFLDSSLIMLPVIAVFILFAAGAEERALRARYLFEGRTVFDFVDRHTTPVVLGMRMAEAFDHMRRHGVDAVAVSDPDAGYAGTLRLSDVLRAMRRGHGEALIDAWVTHDVPIVRADTPAMQAYWFLDAEGHPFVGVVDDDRFVGLARRAAFDTRR